MPRTYKCAPEAEIEISGFRLVPIRDEDKYLIMQWRNEQIDILRQKDPLTREGQERYFKNVVDKLFDAEKPDQVLFSFLENGKLAGYGGLVHIDWESANGEISFLTETSRNVSSVQFKKDWSIYLGMLKQFVQTQLKFVKIYTYAYDIRPFLFEMLLENNFREEARLHKHINVAGTLKDVLIHSYFFNDFAFEAGSQKNLFKVKLNELEVGEVRIGEHPDGKRKADLTVKDEYRGRGFESNILKSAEKLL